MVKYTLSIQVDEVYVMILTFGEALSAIIRKKKLSVSSVAEDLGFSSKTALFRIINGQSKHSSNLKCLELAKESEKLHLTHEEIKDLERALKVSGIGREAYAMSMVFEDLLYPKETSASPVLTKLEGCADAEDFEALLAFYAPRRDVRITIFGGCAQEIISRLHCFAQTADVTRIWHTIFLDEHSPEDISVLGASSSILFSPVYRMSTVKADKDPHENWIFRSGMILFSAALENGGRCAHQLTPLKNGGYFVIRNDDEILQTFWCRMFEEAEDSMSTIKRDHTDVSVLPFPDNYIEFTRNYAAYERNREIYMIKPDIPVFCISQDIIRKPVVEGLAQSGLDEKKRSFIETMYEIQSQRYENVFTKKKDTHIILNREAMQHFARTGRREDHLFFPRPYTPQERVIILQNLANQMRDNPYFHIWFSIDPSFVRDKEVTAYENVGLAIIRSDTSWHLEKDHQEILIESKQFAHYFKHFVRHDILGKHVLPEETSAEIMQELIDIAKNA